MGLFWMNYCSRWHGDGDIDDWEDFFLNEVVRWKRFTAIIFGLVGALISIDPFGSKIDAYVFVALLCPLCAAASYLIVRKYGYQESIFSFIIYGKIFMIIFCLCF